MQFFACTPKLRWNLGLAVAEAGWLSVPVYFDVLFMVVVISCSQCRLCILAIRVWLIIRCRLRWTMYV